VEEGDSVFTERITWKMWKQAMLRRSWMNMVNGNTKSWFINKVAKPWTNHRGNLDFPRQSFNEQWKKKHSN
jgi:L-lactate dehydrogenase complex protein LldF